MTISFLLRSRPWLWSHVFTCCKEHQLDIRLNHEKLTSTSLTCAIIFPCARGRRWPMSLAAITAVRPFLITCFRSPLLADLNSSSRGRIRATSSDGKHSSVSSAPDMLVVDSVKQVKNSKLKSDSGWSRDAIPAAGRDRCVTRSTYEIFERVKAIWWISILYHCQTKSEIQIVGILGLSPPISEERREWADQYSTSVQRNLMLGSFAFSRSEMVWGCPTILRS